MRNYPSILCFAAIVVCLFPYELYADGTSMQAPATKPKVKILEDALCKKCICDENNKKIDCTNKLTNWFTDDEWQALQNGDIIFETINLEHNNLTDVPLLPSYPVKNLFLGFNQIANITKAALQNLTELTKLDISYNKLTSKVLKPDCFAGQYSPSEYLPLTKLTSLNLGYNDLHNLDPDLFEHTPNLEELILCKNTFKVIDSLTETAISGLNSLKTLDISYMELEELPDNFLHGPRELETLILTGNLFDEIPGAIELAPNLKTLVLDENPIEDLVGENIFPPMLNLEYLSISYMQKIRIIGKSAMSNLQNLTTFLASDNALLTYIDVDAFGKNITNSEYLDYPPLQKLYLNNNKLQILPRSLLVRWDKINVIDLRFNPWVCNCSNDWLINSLIEKINATNSVLTNNVECSGPAEYQTRPLLSLKTEQLLVCTVDHSGVSSLILIGLLVGLLIGIPITLSGFVLYRRGCFGLLHRENNAANRQLYNRANFNEEFHI